MLSKLKNLYRKIPATVFVGFVIVAINILACIFAPILAPYPEAELVGTVWEEIGGKFILGTDQVGRDVFSRIIYGARNTISLALIATSLSFLTGVFLGVLAATLGGLFDQVCGRIVDILMAFPALIFSLVVLSILESSNITLVIVIAVIASTRIFRLARALAMDISVLEFVEVARLRGEKLWWVMKDEILPNILPPLAVEFGLRFCFVFLFISALSFLGLGLQPPTADWGSMVRENAGAITFGVLIPLIPAAAIAQLTVGVNLVVDWFLQKTGGEVPDEL
jgi:peptide/nickel transport system permease protein